MKLETKRLLIRPIKLIDREDIFHYRRDKLTNKCQGWIPETLDDVDVFIARCAKKINEPKSWFQLVIIQKENQKLIGDLGLHFFDTENKQVEIGFTLDRNVHNKGFATEAVKQVIDYFINDLNKHRIMASIDPENINAIRLVERIGFRKEAHFVKSLWMNGTWVDDLIYALLENDWQKLSI